jgi:hypothetical protein
MENAVPLGPGTVVADVQASDDIKPLGKQVTLRFTLELSKSMGALSIENFDLAGTGKFWPIMSGGVLSPFGIASQFTIARVTLSCNTAVVVATLIPTDAALPGWGTGAFTYNGTFGVYAQVAKSVKEV